MNYAAQKEAPERLKQARELLKCCNICPRRCGVDRISGQRGFCKLDDSVHCFREMLHWGEERELTPSHQVYFSGCNLKCEFCTVAEWNEQPSTAESIDFRKLKRKIIERKKQGARNLNLLGGEPVMSIHGIIELLSQLDFDIEIVLNSNMYFNSVIDELTAGLVDIYLADLKCGNSSCAQKLLGAEDYFKVAKQNILSAWEHSDVIVRHLIIPGHKECCLEPILNWLVENCPQIKLSLRSDYVPPAETLVAPKEYLAQEEFEEAVESATKMGLNVIK
jgi:putative pyruvate formate lyase activating enzyme